MSITEQVYEIEADLASAGASVDALCRDAGINRSTWTRWKAGAVAPNLATWDRVKLAALSIISSAKQNEAAR